MEFRKDGKHIQGIGAVYYDANDPGTEFDLGGDMVERIMPGAFDDALSGAGPDVVAFFNHDPDTLLGRQSSGTLSMDDTARGLEYSVQVDEDDPDSVRVYRKQERGDLKGSSFMFRVTEDIVHRNEDGPDVREIHKVELYEVGPVVFPAYKATERGVCLRFVDVEGRAVPVAGEQLAEARAAFGKKPEAAAENSDDFGQSADAAIRIAEAD